jgi:hypothetical protein
LDGIQRHPQAGSLRYITDSIPLGIDLLTQRSFRVQCNALGLMAECLAPARPEWLRLESGVW